MHLFMVSIELLIPWFTTEIHLKNSLLFGGIFFLCNSANVHV